VFDQEKKIIRKGRKPKKPTKLETTSSRQSHKYGARLSRPHQFVVSAPRTTTTRTSVMSRSRAAATASVNWSFLALMLLLQQQRQSGAAAVESADRAVGSYGLCSPADSAAACLFKGLLKNAVIYASRRNASAVKGDGQLQQSKGIERYLAEQIRNLLGLFSFGFELPADVAAPWSLFKSSFLDG